MRRETPEQRAFARQVAQHLMSKLNWDNIVELPEFHEMDFQVFRDAREHWVEIKRRFNPMRRYPTLMLENSKVEWAKGKAAVAVVQWNDCLAYVPLHLPHTVQIGGRYDRGDPNDVGPMAHYDIDLFTPLPGLHT